MRLTVLAHEHHGNKRTWISVLIAAVIIVGVLAVSAVGGTAYFIYRHVHTQFVGNETAGQRFAETRARFAGQQPLIEVRKDQEAVLHREVIPKAMPAAKLDTLRVLAYDTRANKLVNVSIPCGSPHGADEQVLVHEG